MYLGIDIGGTKTFVAMLTSDGRIEFQERFPTPKKYDDFLKDLAEIVDKLSTDKIKSVGVGVPGRIDRKNGIAISCGNLGWKNVPIQKDVHKITNHSVVIENDAKVAGLSEALLLKDKFQKIVYVTISTGIGVALIDHQTIDTEFSDRGGNAFMLEHEGNMVSWESFASGKAIVERYGKKIEDINDASTLESIARDIGQGLIDVIAMTEPEVIVIGGGAGQFLSKFIKPLNSYLKQFENPMLTIPPIREAQRPNEAVIYGCYELAKAKYG